MKLWRAGGSFRRREHSSPVQIARIFMLIKTNMAAIVIRYLTTEMSGYD